ncbi:unnamed protein product [Prorocentrum cordatum]|uniref:Uncharacterized protein n=1 Tax=Prorocentrum cordatum TaxID=2364126 RepID=A0ABN9UX90_9DINO|nr:unnamed protein product [Polarella glacialis]
MVPRPGRQWPPEAESSENPSVVILSQREGVWVSDSGTISFDEYCFRFGRRYQMELNRRKRATRAAVGAGPGARAAGPQGAAAAPEEAADEPEGDRKRQQQRKLEEWKLRAEQEELEKEREALRREREELQRERERVDAERRGASGHAGSGAPGNEAAAQGLSAGARVRLQGLQGAAELNGRAATVLRFEAASGRYVVELDGSGEQKSLRAGCLAPLAGGPASPAGGGGGAAAGLGFVERAQAATRRAVVQAQVWVAGSGYQWWQILLGAAVVLLVAAAWAQNSARYSADVGRASSARTFADASAQGPGAYDSPGGLGGDRGLGSQRHGRAGDDRAQGYGRYDDDDDDSRRGHGDRREGRRQPRRGADDWDYDRRGYSPYDYGGGYSSSSGEGEVLGGMLNGLGLSRASQTYIVVGVIGVLCWKGIIPVHRMGWWQLYMLWNMFSPFLLGTRRRGGMGYGMGYGGFGGGMMGRRGFF